MTLKQALAATYQLTARRLNLTSELTEDTRDGLWAQLSAADDGFSRALIDFLPFFGEKRDGEDGDPATSQTAHLPQLLHERVQPLVLGLGVGRYGPTDGRLRLQLQQTAHVVGLLAGGLLQQRLLCGLAVLRHLALVAISLTESLGRQNDAVVSAFLLLYVNTFWS